METPTDWTPYVFGAIPPVLILLGVLVNNAFGVWNRRRGAVETKVPNVTDAWSAADNARDAAQVFREAYYTLQDIVRAVVRRVRRGESLTLTEDEERLIFKHDPKNELGKS